MAWSAMIKTIYFDFGNVIGFFDHWRASKALAMYSDQPVDLIHEILHGDHLLDDYEHGHIDTAEYIRQACERGRIRCTPEEFQKAFVEIFWTNPEVCSLIPGLKPRYRLVLASNTCDAHFTKFTEMFADTLHHLDELGASHTLRARKPNRAFYENAQRLANAEPAECLFVDDRAVNIEAAERFGWKGILYVPDGTLVRKMRAAGVEIR